MKRAHLLAVVLSSACSDPPTVTVDPPGAFLLDHVWSYEQTVTITNDGETLPLSTDRQALERLRYPDGDPPPTGDALTGTAVLFTGTRDVIARPPGFDDYEDFGTRYGVVDDALLRARVRESVWFGYEYAYDAVDGSLALSPESPAFDSAIQLLNDVTQRILTSGALDSVAKRISDALFEDPRVAQAIEDRLYLGIRGYLDTVPSREPQAVADAVAAVVVARLQESDVAGAVEEAIATRVERLTDLDPDATASEMAARIAERIAATLSSVRIASAVLPALQRLDEAPAAEVAATVAQGVYDAVRSVLSEERIVDYVETAWRELADAPTEDVSGVARVAARVIVEQWLNAETFSAAILPIAENIDATPVAGMAALADQVEAQLRISVDAVISRLPGLELTPNWGAIHAAVTAAFVAAKPANATRGAQAVADEVGQLLTDDYLSQARIQGAVESTLLALQDVPAETAASTIGGWLSGLVDHAGDSVVDDLSGRLETLLGELDAKQAAEEIGALAHRHVTQALSEDALYAATLPVVERATQIDPEAGAEWLARLLVDFDVLPSDAVEEAIPSALLPLVEELLPVDRDVLAEELIAGIVGSNVLQGVISPERVETVLRFVLYRAVLEDGLARNVVDRLEIHLRRRDALDGSSDGGLR